MKLTFAEHLREFRAEKKMSLRQLAELLGVSHTLIGLVETNKRTASTKFIRKFAKYSGKDSKLLEFIANPMPLSYKQSICESEGAPNFLKENWVQETIDGKDAVDELCLALFREIEVRNTTEDNIYYRRLISALESMADRPIVECWGEFYNALLISREIGPEVSLRAFQDLYNRLVNESSLQDSFYLRLQTCFKMGEMSQKTESSEQAIQYFVEAREISARMNDDEGYAMSYYLMGETYHSIWDREKAVECFLEGIAIDGSHQHLRARLLLALGRLYRELGRFPEAIEKMKESAKLWKLKAVNDSFNLAKTHQEISSTYYDEGINYDAALDYVHRSLIIFTRLESPPLHPHAKINVIKSKLLKSAIFANTNQLERAKNNLTDIIENYHQLITTELNEANEIMREAHELLGLVYEKNKRWAEAEESYKRLTHYPSADGKNLLYSQLRVFINLHKLYNKKNNKVDSISMLLQADSLINDVDYSDLKLTSLVIELRRLQGNMAFDQGNTQEGVKYHLEACDLSRKCDTVHLLTESLKSIGNQIKWLHTNSSTQIFALALYNTITSWIRKYSFENLSTDIQNCQHLFEQV